MLPPLPWVDQGQALPLRSHRLHLLQRGLALPDELVATSVAVKHLQAGGPRSGCQHSHMGLAGVLQRQAATMSGQRAVQR